MIVHAYSCGTTPRPPMVPEIPPVGPEEMPVVSDPVIFPEPVNDPDIDLPEIPVTDPDYMPDQPGRVVFQS